MSDDNPPQAPPVGEGGGMDSLIQGRSKRSTAGRHMSALLNAEAEDELALLFEEVEDDNDFFEDADGDAGDDDDVLESSSDDDDQGPNGQGDELEGETELQKEAKAENKKRKKQETFNLQSLRKKVKIDPAAVPEEPAARPKKKSERISWIPTVEDGPTRSSSRRQTMHNKQLTHERLKDSEVKRVRLIATMEEAAKRKARYKPKQMTQADRLAEAERVERHNSKSLNRWEETEKRKAEERLARIEALQNRRLQGPVMSYWSGVATWVNGRLTRVGKVDITAKPPKEENNRKKSKKPEREETKPAQMAVVDAPTLQPTPVPVPENSQGSEVPNGEASKEQAQSNPQADPSPAQTTQENGQASAENGNQATREKSTPPVPTEASTGATATLPSAEISGALGTEADPATKPPPEQSPKEPTEKAAADETPKEDVMDIDEKPDVTKKPGPETEGTLQSEEKPIAEPAQPAVETAQASEVGPPSAPATAAPGDTQPGVPTPTPQEQLAPEIHLDQPGPTNEGAPSGTPPPPPTIEQTGRTLTILENFDDKTAHNREFNIYFNAKKPPRLTKISSSLCMITSLPSRYRDPETSLPFANAYAHKEIHNTIDQRYAWSPMLGCYIGPAGVAARGVPERFLGPQAPGAEKQDRAETE